MLGHEYCALAAIQTQRKFVAAVRMWFFGVSFKKTKARLMDSMRTVLRVDVKLILILGNQERINMKTALKVSRFDDRGVSAVEYAIMLVLVGIAVMAFGDGIAQSVTGVFSKLASGLSR